MLGVCVLISTYNGEKYLRQLLDSVCKQDNNNELNISIYVRDDGSKDGTVDILKEYENSGLLTILEIGKNIGFAQSFSWLLKNAPRTDYYAFCDQDDVWLPKKILNAILRLKKEDNTIPLLYSTSLIVVDKNLKEITRNTHRYLSKISPFMFEENVLQNNTYGCTIVINNALRSLYCSVSSEKIKSHDYFLTILATGLGKFIFDENPQILYRQHANNTIGFYKGDINNFIRTIKFALNIDFKNNKITNVQVCKEYFYDMFCEEHKKFIDLLINYKKDKKQKKLLITFIKNNIKNKFVKNYNLFLIRFNKF